MCERRDSNSHPEGPGPKPGASASSATLASGHPRARVVAVLTEGSPAPDFTVPDQDGSAVTLSDLRGRWVLLWWYPKADTPG